MNNSNELSHQKNLNRYNDVEVVDYYAHLEGLEPNERGLFERHIPSNARILDIGVGGGRTTTWLASRSASYLGIDYALAMVEVCQHKFPTIRFMQMDATDLSAIATASIDVVVFSFNGIDCIYPAMSRTQCLHEVNRVLVPGGLFIFSEHNARRLIVKPSCRGVGPLKRVWRIVRAAVLTARLCVTRPLSAVFRAGCGYEPDPVHGGLMLYAGTQKTIGCDLMAAGFVLVETAGVDWPAQSHPWVTPWYYFVARSMGNNDRVDSA
jgi:2-polyprenyl-3-methyl-5-hydroxy-6-metoxy-1,4-benzoquinol methylase